jgi:hypothetical protein
VSTPVPSVSTLGRPRQLALTGRGATSPVLECELPAVDALSLLRTEDKRSSLLQLWASSDKLREALGFVRG